MATFPSIETVLMEVHQNLGLKQGQTKIKIRMIKQGSFFSKSSTISFTSYIQPEGAKLKDSIWIVTSGQSWIIVPFNPSQNWRQIDKLFGFTKKTPALINEILYGFDPDKLVTANLSDINWGGI